MDEFLVTRGVSHLLEKRDVKSKVKQVKPIRSIDIFL